MHLLQPSSNVAGQGPLWEALSDNPEFRLDLAVPARGGWLSLAWDSALTDPVSRPILIFEREDEAGKPFESDALLAGACFGHQNATVFVPPGTRTIRLSPCLGAGPFGYRLTEARWISPFAAFLRGLRVQPFAALHAYGAWLIRRPHDFRLLLSEAIGARPYADYPRWKAERLRAPEWDGFDRSRLDHLPRLRIAGDAGTAGVAGRLPPAVPIDCQPLSTEGGSLSSVAACTEGLVDSDLVLLVRPGVVLLEHAIPALMRAAAERPEMVLFYGDEEIETSDGRLSPRFLPGFDPISSFALLRHSGVFAIRAGLLRDWAAGRPPPANAQAFAIHRPLARRSAVAAPAPFAALLDWLAQGWPLNAGPEEAEPEVAIIIPTRDRLELLRACIESIEPTLPPRTEIVIIDNESREPETLRFFTEFASRPRRQVLPAPGPFNFSHLCNLGARATSARVLVFLNNDTTVIAQDWVKKLWNYAISPECGAVGARLLYPSGHVQHAGIAIGIGGYAGHVDLHVAGDAVGQFERARRDHSLLAVTGACLAVERQKFDAIGGFDAEHLPVDLNDVDLCLRLVEKGWRTIFASESVLVHHESASRGRQPGNPRYWREKAYFAGRWRHFRRADPAFHPALSLLLTRPSLG